MTCGYLAKNPSFKCRFMWLFAELRCGAPWVSKYGNPSVRENLAEVTVRPYVHPTMYANVKLIEVSYFLSWPLAMYWFSIGSEAQARSFLNVILNISLLSLLLQNARNTVLNHHTMYSYSGIGWIERTLNVSGRVFCNLAVVEHQFIILCNKLDEFFFNVKYKSFFTNFEELWNKISQCGMFFSQRLAVIPIIHIKNVKIKI